MKVLSLLLALLSLPGLSWAAAPAAPVSISVTSVYDDDATVYWDVSAGASKYILYSSGAISAYSLNNVLALTGLDQGVQYILNVTAINTDGEESAHSVNVTFTAGGVGPPTAYLGAMSVSNTASNAVQIAGSITNTVIVTCTNCGGVGSGYTGVTLIAASLAIPVSVTAGVAGISTTAYLATGTNTIGAVTQGSAWLVSGSVQTTPSDSFQGVSVFSGVAGLTVTASQGSAWTVSGSVGVTSGMGGISVTVGAVPTLTKGTQGSTGFMTQDIKDSGRVNVIYYATAIAAGTTGTETAITLTKASDMGATSAAVSHVIPSGKRLRFTSITFATRGHNTATAQITTFKLRINTAGAVITTTTPIVLQARCATPATANSWDRFVVPIGDGIEFLGNGTIQFGVTAAAVYTTNAPTWDVLITGFEY